MEYDSSLLNNGGAALLKILGRHILGQLVQMRTPDGRLETRTFSSFVCFANNTWYVFTAGHIIQNLKDEVRKGCVIKRWEAVDTFGEPRFKTAWPLGWRPDDFDTHYNDAEIAGIDLATIKIDGLHIQGLKANGIEPFDLVADLDRLGKDSIKEFFLLGFPAEGQQMNGLRAHIAHVGIPITPLAIEDVDPALRNGSHRRFYGAIEHDLGLVRITTIDRMSGGPLLGLWYSPDKSKFRYMVIGVQSAWSKESKHIAAWPIDYVADRLRQREQQRNQMLSRMEAMRTSTN